MASNFNAHMSEEQLQKIFHDGITATFRTNLRNHLMEVAKQEIEQIVDQCAKGLIGKIVEYRGFNSNTGMPETNYVINIDGVKGAVSKL